MTEPLAVRMRPRILSEVVGQDHLTFPGSPLDLLVSGRTAVSVLLYDPPGTGETTLAHVITGSADADKLRYDTGRPTILFVDEIHRFSTAQQDVLLPAVEIGMVSLAGATTENPSFSVNATLASRSILMVLKGLDDTDVADLLHRTVDDPRGLNDTVWLDDDAAALIARLASGDVRQALNRLEVAAQLATAANQPVEDAPVPRITTETVNRMAGTAMLRYDTNGDQHYDVISAFIKSMRGSDPDATLYWLARMIKSGEDPRFIARRIVVHASEDVGMADPSILPIAVAAAQAVQLIGLPEVRINLAQAVVAVATAPKSNAVVRGIDTVRQAVRHGLVGDVPVHLRDAHYPGAIALGRGEGYLYPHDHPHGVMAQQYLPDDLVGAQFYQPTTNGFEATVTARLEAIKQLTHPSREGDH